MNIVIGSAFRNASYYLDRYFGQVIGLSSVLASQGHTLKTLIAAEGDSVDDTRERLRQYAERLALNLRLPDCSHGGEWFGSTEQNARMIAMSKVGNAIFNSVSHIDSALVYIESDLVWEPETMGVLVNMALTKAHGFDVFAPMVFAGPHFYDIWGFRKDDIRFTPFPPYHEKLNGDGVAEIDSAGSCLVMRGEVARKCRIRNDYCLVGWCQDARERGYKIGVVPSLRIYHP